jgi:hypothetical protein
MCPRPQVLRQPHRAPLHGSGAERLTTEARKMARDLQLRQRLAGEVQPLRLLHALRLLGEAHLTPPPAHVGPSFAIPMQARVLSKDCRCKKHHLELWKRFTTASFELEEMPGNHLFFYDVPARDEWMKSILKKLPTPFFPEACID